MPVVHRPFRPTHALGTRAVLGAFVDGEHDESLCEGAALDDDGEAVPVVVHLGGGPVPGLGGATRASLFDEEPRIVRERAHLEARCRLRTQLRGHGVPRVFSRIVADGSDRRPHDAYAGFVEEHAGVVNVTALLAASRAAGGVLPIGVCLALARAFAVPFAAIERLAPGTNMQLTLDAVFVDVDGVVRCLVDPLPFIPDELHAEQVMPARYRPRIPYLSFEAARGGSLDLRHAMYTLGLLLFELVAGDHPLRTGPAMPDIELWMASFNNPIPSLAMRRADVPRPLVQLVSRLTARAADDRFARWADVVANIDDVAQHSELALPRDIAAVLRGLLPDVVDRAIAHHEQLGMLDLVTAAATLPRLPGLVVVVDPALPSAAPAGDAPAMTTIAPDDDWGDVTPSDARVGSDGRAMWSVDDHLRIDQTPVTQAAWASFCRASRRAPPTSWRGPTPPPELAETPITGVSFADATAYATHYGKGLPSDDEWQRAFDVVGAARLGTGAVWEWTTTLRRTGWVVCGGRFRDRPGIPSDGQTSSWEDAAADDVGFRCVVRVSDTRRR